MSTYGSDESVQGDNFDYSRPRGNVRHDMDAMANRLDEVVKRVPNLDGTALFAQVKSEKAQMDANNRMNIFQNQNQAVIENARMFNDMTQTLGNYNEAYNSNVYTNRNLESEKKRVGRLVQMSKNDLHTANQTYLRENYKHQLYIFLSNIILFTILAMSTGYTILSESFALTQTASYTLFTVVIVAYALSVSFELYRHSMRLNPFHWNRLYFKTDIKTDDVFSRKANTNTVCKTEYTEDTDSP